MIQTHFLISPAYSFGKEELPFHTFLATAPEAKTNSFSMDGETIDKLRVHQSRDIFVEAFECIAATMKGAALRPELVDIVVFFSSQAQGNFRDSNQRIGNLLKDLSLAPHSIFHISGTGCASALSAIQHAHGMLAGPRNKVILFVGLEKIVDESSRLQEYAVSSDAATSFILANTLEPFGQPSVLFAVRGTIVRSDAELMITGFGLGKRNLLREVLGDLMAQCQSISSEIDFLASSNLFHPIKVFKDTMLGFKSSQMFLGNCLEHGHALSCDPLINLVDIIQAAPRAAVVLLASESQGHAGATLLQMLYPETK